MRQTFVVLVKNTPGLLARVEALFRRQAVSLESLAFHGADEASVTIVAEASDEKTDLLVMHLRRLVDVKHAFSPRALRDTATLPRTA
ncbi:MAG TPA: ACT domain-containing protein [Thermoanaerobaculia bacterium]|nr:ACT domain-containing protein [Thermoanaerobaculia bacterium]